MRIRLSVFFFLLPLLGFTQFNDTAYISTFGGIQNEVCNQAMPTWDGGYVLIGTTNSFGHGGNNIYVVKTDSLGKHKWSNFYGGTGTQEGFSITPTLDKGYAMLGFTSSYGAGGYDVYLVKTDSNGKVEWQQTYGGSDWDFGYSIAQTKDSGYVICGQTYSYGAGDGDVYVVRTDKMGDTLWTRTIGGPGFDMANDVYVYKDSLYYIVGATTSYGLGHNGDTSMYVLVYNNNGQLRWDTTLGSTHNNNAHSIRGNTPSGFIIYGSMDSVPSKVAPANYGEAMIQMDSNHKIQWWDIFAALTGDQGLGRDALQVSRGWYITVGTTNNCGAGGYAMDIQRLNPGGWWQTGACFGGTGDELGSSIAYHDQYHMACVGSSNSPGYTAGLFDFYMVRFANDSLVAGYKLKIRNYTDTLSPDNVNSVQSGSAAVKVYPEPMTDHAEIIVQGGPVDSYHFNLYDVIGRNVISNMPLTSIGHGQYAGTVLRNGMAAGAYIYKISDQQNVVATGKLLVQ